MSFDGRSCKLHEAIDFIITEIMCYSIAVVIYLTSSAAPFDQYICRYCSALLFFNALHQAVEVQNVTGNFLKDKTRKFFSKLFYKQQFLESLSSIKFFPPFSGF
jgi:hypothetical protein